MEIEHGYRGGNDRPVLRRLPAILGLAYGGLTIAYYAVGSNSMLALPGAEFILSVNVIVLVASLDLPTLGLGSIVFWLLGVGCFQWAIIGVLIRRALLRAIEADISSNT